MFTESDAAAKVDESLQMKRLVFCAAQPNNVTIIKWREDARF
jgi:hypothetical protein